MKTPSAWRGLALGPLPALAMLRVPIEGLAPNAIVFGAGLFALRDMARVGFRVSPGAPRR